MLYENNLTKKKVPKVPFSDIADFILGTDYEASLNFIDNKESHKINLAYRKIDKPTNILSFPLEKNLGEIFLNIEQVTEEYRAKSLEFFPKLEPTLYRYCAFLVIHGLLHLAGLDHGAKMESEEQRVLKHFGF